MTRTIPKGLFPKLWTGPKAGEFPTSAVAPEDGSQTCGSDHTKYPVLYGEPD